MVHEMTVVATSAGGISYCKLGLSFARPDRSARWRTLCTRWNQLAVSPPGWVAVAYIYWRAARAPDPDSIIRSAVEFDDCHGVVRFIRHVGKTAGTLLDHTWEGD